jgi:hypothetical protein
VGEGYLQMPATRLAEVAAARGWSAGQVQSAQRLIDGGMGEHLGYKAFEETTVGEGSDALEGEAWVYYLYDERVEEVEGLV